VVAVLQATPTILVALSVGGAKVVGYFIKQNVIGFLKTKCFFGGKQNRVEKLDASMKFWAGPNTNHAPRRELIVDWTNAFQICIIYVHESIFQPMWLRARKKKS
jgi:hypothetical protein